MNNVLNHSLAVKLDIEKCIVVADRLTALKNDNLSEDELNQIHILFTLTQMYITLIMNICLDMDVKQMKKAIQISTAVLCNQLEKELDCCDKETTKRECKI